LSAIDLHCHSDRSDGALAPAALVERAAARGVRMLALTDHDTLDGLDDAYRAARAHDVALVPGVEVSTTWSGRTLHVVGLNVDPADAQLRAGLATIRTGRLQRAEAIAQRLAKVGIGSALDGAMALASSPDAIGRGHFARYLVAAGVTADVKTAFRRLLGEGKPGYVRHCWSALPDVIRWIREAGGSAVLAHPVRYGLRAERLQALLAHFRELGGSAVEVLTAGQDEAAARRLGELAQATGLAASQGSDFHDPQHSWLDLGELADVPAGCVPLWRHWGESAPAALA
jgi:predicted metal-dependent phosphoesterase TrpH